jgi:hypothetical protein
MIRDFFARVRLPKGKNRTGDLIRRKDSAKGTIALSYPFFNPVFRIK